jgi:pimeloyl-ACP methyl ester carboxylesterase
MKSKMSKRILLSMALFAGAVAAPASVMAATPVHNIVLVHGAWVNGSGWKPVYDILVKDGYHVSIAEHPLTSFNDDVTAVKRIVDMQDGPTILVGHSYGGAIITDVGNDPKVVGLVYIAAHALDQGETEVANSKRFPNATSKTKDVKKTADGFLYLDPSRYPATAGRIRSECSRADRCIGIQLTRRTTCVEDQAQLVRRGNGRSHHQSGPGADVRQARA